MNCQKTILCLKMTFGAVRIASWFTTQFCNYYIGSKFVQFVKCQQTNF